jgi:aryl-alcohol dehydrogenase-like predicted oxidoreductase
MARFSHENHDANSALIAAIGSLGASRGATPAQIALAWLHHQAGVFGLAVVPIPGTRKPSRIEENVGGAQLSLAGQEISTLSGLADRVRGGRDRKL